MAKKQPLLDPNRFEEFVDFDVDGAAFQVGLKHCVIGPAGPAIRIMTGALEILFTAHITDIDLMISGLKDARKELRRLEKERAK